VSGRYGNSLIQTICLHGCHTSRPEAYGRVGVPAHYVGHEPGILDRFFEYSLKLPQIYSVFLYQAGTEVYQTRQAGMQSRRVGGRTDNPICWDSSRHVVRSWQIQMEWTWPAPLVHC
jgi:hypothetical protein